MAARAPRSVNPSVSPATSALTDLPLIFWDERLSTQAAERTLLSADSSRKRRKQVIDKMAAAYILQGALDRLAVLTRNKEAESR